MIAEPPNAARCWEVDRLALARCPRLPARHRVILGELVGEGERRAAELQELLDDIRRARGAVDSLPWKRRLPEPPAACLSARTLLLRAVELLAHGEAGPALDRMRKAAAELKPQIVPRDAAGGGSR